MEEKNKQKSISIFAKPYFVGQDPGISTGAYVHRGTSLIRGKQVAHILGGKYNPASGSEHDIKIYLKPRNLDTIKDGSYVDFSDAEPYLLSLLQKRPKLNVIASSFTSYEYLKSQLPNTLFLIPEHHCNFERVKRTRKTVTTGGIITNPSPLSYSVNREVKNALATIGFDFLECYNWQTREDVMEFYKKIDFQVIAWFGVFNDEDPFRHPTKIINAASFGIPTVANWKFGYKEFEGNYIPVHTMDEMIQAVEKLKNKTHFDKFADKISIAAKRYHIETIAQEYKKLR